MEETYRDRWERIVNQQHGDFNKIPPSDRLHPSKTLCGYLKVVSLMKAPEKFWTQGEHDIVYLPHPRELQELTDEDILYLGRCGIFYDTECDSLAHHT